MMPTHLMNFQAWLAAQGLAVQDGIVPENNISDIGADAWNDSFTVSDGSSSENSGGALIIMEQAKDHSSAHNFQQMQEQLSVTVDMHSHGIRFGLSNQGNQLLSLLLAEPIPRHQLNTSIYHALRPYLATVGPWRNAYGVWTETVHVEIQVTSVDDELQFTQIVQPQISSTITIQELDMTVADVARSSQPSLLTAEPISFEGSAVIPSQNMGLSEDAVNALSENPPMITEPVELHQLSEASETETVALLTSEVSGNMISDSDCMAPPPSMAPDLQHNIAPSSSTAEAQLKNRKGKTVAPLSTAPLRRSTRQNKYDGFRVSHNQDSRPTKSKVRPRIIPSAVANEHTSEEL